MVLGKEHPSTLDTINSIASVYHNQGRYKELLEWDKKALAGYEMVFDPEHEKTITPRRQVANLDRTLWQWTREMTLLRQLLGPASSMEVQYQRDQMGNSTQRSRPCSPALGRQPSEASIRRRD